MGGGDGNERPDQEGGSFKLEPKAGGADNRAIRRVCFGLPIIMLVCDGGVSSETAFNRCLDMMVDLPQEAQQSTCGDLWLL